MVRISRIAKIAMTDRVSPHAKAKREGEVTTSLMACILSIQIHQLHRTTRSWRRQSHRRGKKSSARLGSVGIPGRTLAKPAGNSLKKDKKSLASSRFLYTYLGDGHPQELLRHVSDPTLDGLKKKDASRTLCYVCPGIGDRCLGRPILAAGGASPSTMEVDGHHYARRALGIYLPARWSRPLD